MNRFRSLEALYGGDASVDVAPLIACVCFTAACVVAGMSFCLSEAGKCEARLNTRLLAPGLLPPENRTGRESGPPANEAGLAVALARVDAALNSSLIGSAARGVESAQAKALDPQEVLADSEMARAPRLISGVKPDYPSELRQQEVTGRVLTAFVVTPEGRVTDLRIEQSANAAFDAAALAAVRQWRFEPGRKGGRAIPYRMRAPITFRP